ncbi:MAG: TRAP transporter small permease subunit [Arenicellales bacterium]|nr:TRAP transporter small permease subunit [Arenicellales bacterium]
MSRLDRLLAGVDTLSLRSGQVVSFLLLPICGVMVFEVVARYMFNAPTTWSTEMVVMFAGTLFIVGGAYTHYLRGHISVDTVYGYLPPRWQAATRVFVHFPLFFLYVGVLLWTGTIFFWDSMVENERSGSLWNPIIWPYKFVVPLGALLVFLQGLAQFIRDVRALVTGKDLGVGPSDETEPEI